MTQPDPAPVVALYLDAPAWEGVLDAIGAAAEWTSTDIDCDVCAGTEACDLHDGDWGRVAQWRAVATRLRDQLTAQRSRQKEETW